MIDITDTTTKTLHLRHGLAVAAYTEANEAAAEYKLNATRNGGNMSDVRLPSHLQDRLIETLNRKRDAQLAWWAHCGGILPAYDVERQFAEAGESFVG